MADTDVIARVYPFQDRTEEVQPAIEKSSRCMPPKVRKPPQQSRRGQGSRDSTASPVPYDPDELPCLEVRFNNSPRTPSGLVFGTDTTCDIVLPKIPGVSKRHFALTYKNSFPDGCYRLVVRDLGSKYGTKVTYGTKGDEPRSDFDWIIDEFRLLDSTKPLIVHLHEDVKLHIIAMPHDIASPAYVANVERFRKGAANPETLLDGLELQSGPSTEGNSGAHTPVVKNPIHIPMGWIAQGAFGSVSHLWNVSTGEEYACKRPLGKYNRKDWKKEIDIMRSICHGRHSHDHIVRLCSWAETPEPCLYLEYMSFGNLDDQHMVAHFSYDECLAILQQASSALEYLHGRPQPVVHRDIKPENILVKHRPLDRNPDSLHIKLSDFGLSKTGSLKTFCGSQTYCPPEVRDEAVPYTKAVDIWSLGVVVLRFAYNLPYPGSGMGMKWCKKIVEEASSWESEGVIDILQRMLVIEAGARYSALACWREASRLIASSEDRSATPTPAYGAGCGATTVTKEQEPEQYLSPVDGKVYPPTADLNWPDPFPDEDLNAFSEGPRHARSNAPPPSKTPAAEPSSTSSGRRSKRHKSISSRHTESQAEVDYYEDCWLDPLHELGGGSSLAKMKAPSRNRSRATPPSSALDWTQSTDGNLSQNVADPQRHTAGGNDAAQDHLVGWADEGGAQVAGTDSDRFMAAALFQTAGGEDEDNAYDAGRLGGPGGGGGSADNANVDRLAEFPVYQQGTDPFGEQDEYAQFFGGAEEGRPAGLDPPGEPESRDRRRKRTK